ncbi:MAG: exodeoxyribonuclease I [Lysobacterales bacterium]|jgi:exodeoxyribonuclease-1
MKPPKSFLWHDYETFGANPFADRPAQFAALRTDADLNPVADPVVWYCAPADDVLPHPEACLITGITPQAARREGLVETDFAQRILDEMSQPGTCSAGYNSIRFDDVFTRNLFYRNLRDPYEREYRNGNSRWDLIDLARMCYALRPDGVEWPMHEAERPSFRLEDLTAANGISHEGAHDALSDVRATIGLARRLRSAQPRLFQWALDMRDKEQSAGLLDTVAPKPVLHTSSRIPAERGCTAIVLPLAVVPNQPKAVVVFDLSADPAPLVREPAEMIHDLVFTAAEDLPDDVDRLPLKVVRTNHVPMLAPLATLKGVDAARIKMDPEKCLEHARQLMPALTAVQAKVAEVFGAPYAAPDDRSDPDRMLYSGSFFSPADRHLMNKILKIPPAELGGHVWSFQDARLPLMLFRYRARNYPDTLSAKEAETWDRDRKARLVETDDPDYFTVRDFRAALARAREEHRDQVDALRILDRLDAWVTEIGLERL